MPGASQDQLVLEVVIDSSKAKGKLSELDDEGKKLDRTIGTLTGTSDRFYGAMRALGTVLLVDKLRDYALGLAGVNTANSQMINMLKFATGSQQGANKEYDYAVSLSKRLGLSLQETAGGYGQLAAAIKATGKDISLARDIFTGMSEAANVLHLSGMQMGRGLMALQQIASKGKVSTEELRVQLGDLLPGAMGLAAKSMDMGVEKFTEMVTAGKIMSEDFLPKFAKTLHETFGGQVMQSLQSSLNNLQTAIFEMQLEASKSGFAEKFSAGIDKMTATVASPELHTAMNQLANELGELVSVAADVVKFMAENAGDIVLVVKALVAVELAGWLVKTAEAIRIFAATNPELAVIIGTLIAMQRLTKEMEGIADPIDSFQKAIQGMQAAKNTLGDIEAKYKAIANELRTNNKLTKEEVAERKASLAELANQAKAQKDLLEARELTINNEVAAKQKELDELRERLVLAYADEQRLARSGGGAGRGGNPQQSVETARNEIRDINAEIKKLEGEINLSEKLMLSTSQSTYVGLTGVIEDFDNNYAEHVDKVTHANSKLISEFEKIRAKLDPLWKQQKELMEDIATLKEGQSTPELAMPTREFQAALALLNKQLEEIIAKRKELDVFKLNQYGNTVVPTPIDLTGQTSRPNMAGREADEQSSAEIDALWKERVDRLYSYRRKKEDELWTVTFSKWMKKYGNDLVDIASMLADVFDGINNQVASLLRLTAQVVSDYQSLSELAARNKAAGVGGSGGVTRTEGAMYGAGVGQQVGQIGVNNGWWQGNRGNSQYGLGQSGDHGDTGSSVGGAIGGAIGSMWGPVGTMVGSAIGGFIGGTIGQSFKRGAEIGMLQLKQQENEVISIVGQPTTNALKNMGDALIDVFSKAVDITGGSFKVPDVSITVIDDMVKVVVGRYRVFVNDMDAAITYAVSAMLASAPTDIPSATADVLRHYTTHASKSNTPDQLLSDLSFANDVTNINRSDTGKNFDDLNDKFGKMFERAAELEMGVGSLVDILSAWDDSVTNLRESLVDQINALAGIYTSEPERAAESFSRSFKEIIKQINDFNAEVEDKNEARLSAIARIQQQLTRETQALEQALRGNGNDNTPSTPENPDGPVRVGRGPGGGSNGDPDAIRARMAALQAQLDALANQAVEAGIDLVAAMNTIIEGSAHFFDDALSQWLNTGTEFHKQIVDTTKGFEDMRRGALKLRDDNLALATTEEQRNRINQIYQNQLTQITQAEANFTQQMRDNWRSRMDAFKGTNDVADQLKAIADEANALKEDAADAATSTQDLADKIAEVTAAEQDRKDKLGKSALADIYEGIAKYIKDAKLREEFLYEAANIRYKMEKFQLLTNLNILKANGLVADVTYNHIMEVLGSLPDDLPKGPKGGAGGGKKDAKQNFLDELARLEKGPLGEVGSALEDIHRKYKDMLKQMKDLGLHEEDRIKKLEEAEKLRLKREVVHSLRQDINDTGPVGMAIEGLKKQREDLLKNAKELGIPIQLIRRWFREAMADLSEQVNRQVRSFSDLSGVSDSILSIKDNAKDLIKSVNEMGWSADRTSEAIDKIKEAEQKRLEVLANNTIAGVFDVIAKYSTDEQTKAWATAEAARIRYQYEIEMAKIQLQVLEAFHLINPDDFTKMMNALNALPTLPPGAGGTSGSDLKASIKNYTDKSGLKAQFDAITAEAKGFTDAINKALAENKITAEEAAKALADVSEEEQRRSKMLADQVLGGIFDVIGRYADNESDKQWAMQQAANLRWSYEIAMAETQLEYLYSIGKVQTETYNRLMGIFHDIETAGPPTITPPDGSGGGGYRPPGISGSTEDAQQYFLDAMLAYNDLLGQLEQYRNGNAASQISETAQKFNALVSEFQRYYALAAVVGGNARENIDALLGFRLADFWKQVLQPIKDFHDSLNLSEYSPLTAQQRLAEAQNHFNQVAAGALSGNLDDISNFTQAWQQLLQEAQGLGTSTPQYDAIYQQAIAAYNQLINAGIPVSLQQQLQNSLHLDTTELEDVMNTVNNSIITGFASLEYAVRTSGSNGTNNGYVNVGNLVPPATSGVH